MTLKQIILFFIFTMLSAVTFAQQNVESPTSSQPNFKFRAVAELGFLGVFSHNIQFSKSGTDFDYKNEGGQDVLFPVSRLSLEFDFKKRNTLVLLYQPLRLESQVLLESDLIVDELTFPASSNVKVLYDFPFYRISYLRELLPNNLKFKLGIGASLQIRNATISFESGDGKLYRTNRDVGPVPILKLKGKAQLSKHVYAELEADGFYAPVSYINGDDNEVIGAILDASFRIGLNVIDPVDTFINLRYLGGGSVGVGDIEGPGDGYTKNWLHFLTVTAGFVYAF